jgi:hypothetical protein
MTSERRYPSSNAPANELIGKTVVNSYGWTVGKIIGFNVDAARNVSSIGVMLNDGGFVNSPIDRFSRDQNAVVLKNSWRTKAEDLTAQIAMMTKKITALTELKTDMDVPKNVCDELENRFAGEKSALLEDRRLLSDQLNARRDAITAQLNEIYEFITHTKINLHLGHIDQDAYQGSYLSGQLMIERLVAEREDIEYALNAVATNLSALPPEPLQSLPPSQPPVVPIKLQIREKDL